MNTHTTHTEEISGAEKLVRALRDTFGASQGLNADSSYDAWPIGRGLWILNNEDGTFALVKRITVGDELVIEELGRIQPMKRTLQNRKLYDLKRADADFFRVLAMIPKAKFEHVGQLWCEAWLTEDEAKRANEFSTGFAVEINR